MTSIRAGRLQTETDKTGRASAALPPRRQEIRSCLQSQTRSSHGLGPRIATNEQAFVQSNITHWLACGASLIDFCADSLYRSLLPAAMFSKYKSDVRSGRDCLVQCPRKIRILPFLTPHFVSVAHEYRAFLGLRGFYEPATVVDPDDRIHAGCLHLELAQTQLLHPKGALEAALLFHG